MSAPNETVRPGSIPGPQDADPGTVVTHDAGTDPLDDERLAADAAALRRALGQASRRVKRERGDAGLPDPQFNVLALLHRHGPMTPGQLADAERVQPPSITRSVNCLAEIGLVSKAGDPDDGRQVRVSLTDAGRHEVTQTRRRRDAWLASRLAALSPPEREVLATAAELLARVAAS